MSRFLYGLDPPDLEQVGEILLGTYMPLGLAMRKAKVSQLADSDEVTKQLREDLGIVKCSACNTWTDKSDDDPAGPLCEACAL